MKSHESVLKANFDITEEVKTGDTSGAAAPVAGWHARKYLHHGEEVMEKRFIVHAWSDRVNLQSQCNALGSFQQATLFTITREQFEFLKTVWL